MPSGNRSGLILVNIETPPPGYEGEDAAGIQDKSNAMEEDSITGSAARSTSAFQQPKYSSQARR